MKAPPNAGQALLRAATVAALLLAAPTARALCVSPLCSCNVTTTAVAFGAFNPLTGSASDSVGNVRVSCSGVVGLLVPYRVDLSAGSSGNVAARRMTSGARQLAYGLYSDSTRSSVWGDTAGTAVNGGILLDVLGLSPPVDHAVYGRIPAGQLSAVPGVYSDTITVTLTYY